ncbi:MAG: hypothetical protein AB7O71_16100 [Hyphomicrobiaceae bacterium]
MRRFPQLAIRRRRGTAAQPKLNTLVRRIIRRDAENEVRTKRQCSCRYAIAAVAQVTSRSTVGAYSHDGIAGQILDATKVVTSDAGHAANLHQPVYFNRVVETFLDLMPA